MLCGVVAPCYQHYQPHGGVDNKMPQLHATQSEALDYKARYHRLTIQDWKHLEMNPNVQRLSGD